MKEKEQQYSQNMEMQTLSEDLFGVEELEERLELAANVVDVLCVANACGVNGCAGNLNW